MKSTLNGVTTCFIGGHYEVTGSTVTKYYGVYPEPSRRAGAQRVATPALAPGASVRTGSTLSYFLSDHLGSTSITTNSTGGLVSELRYKPWGETRYSSGTTPAKYQYTGQYSNMSDFGLMFYNARWMTLRWEDSISQTRSSQSNHKALKLGIDSPTQTTTLLNLMILPDIARRLVYR